jgi:hypothetical protein
MNDRPVAGVLACLAALTFIVAFAAAAVTRPETAPVAASHATRTSPAAAREGEAVAGTAVPGMSRVAALPSLRLPVHKRVKHTHHAKPAAPAVQVAAAPVATPAPVATATPAPVVAARPAAPVAKSHTAPYVGQSFDSSG